MANIHSTASFDKQIRTLFSIGTMGAMTDDALLGQFARGGEAAEPAFATLVERHGPMVMRVCRNLLADAHLAEDAFQVSFLLLARRAGAIHNPGALAGWLHRVARRVALHTRVRANRKKDREQLRADDVAIAADHPAERDELCAIVHQEIDRLENTQRLPILLCAVEGLSHEEAAQRLGWPVGTVKSRLVRGRRRLEARLSRRGLAPAIVVAAASSTEASSAVPLALAVATTRIAVAGAAATDANLGSGAISTTVASLLKKELSAMFFAKLKLAAGAILAVGAAVALIGVALGQHSGKVEPQAAPAKAIARATKAEGDRNASEAKDGKDFELRVVGPSGKPIPAAVVELRTDAVPTVAQIRQGKLVRSESYGAFVATDVEGRIAVELSRAPTYFDAFITIPSYGPYWAGWSSESHTQPIPSQFTAELEAAWSAGGIIVDSQGKPIEGVTIGPAIEYKKRPGDVRQMRGGKDQKTDSAGKWHFDSVPVSTNEVFVEINHPGFRPLRRSLTRGEFGIEPGREPVAEVVLDRGLMVTGKVTDEAGKPIVGARLRTKFLNDIREATTGSDGVYRLAGCEPRTARIVVSAKGRATDMKELRIDSETGPVDFRMKPGGAVRIRVLDQRGNPVPKARIFFQEWRGRFSYFEFDHVGEYADKNGVWVWSEAPLDEFKADICPPDGMTLSEQPLIARAEEYVFRVPDPLAVSGQVIDANTRKPIKAFRVVPGVRSSVTHMNWVPSESFSASDGRFQFRASHGYFAHLIRIEADGYQAAVSRDIKSTEGKVTIDFELKKGKDIIAKVVTPRNLSAGRAKVALGVAGSQINIQNGEIDDGSTYSTRLEADDEGRFHFPQQDKDFQLVITHASGYAHIKSAPQWESARIIHLEPWARVEGTFRIGNTPAANVPITLVVDGRSSYGDAVPSVFPHHDMTTGPDGRFVFDRVIPGSGRIGRHLMFTVDDGAAEVTSSCMIAASFPAGETAHIDLGGIGRPVVGKLAPPEDFRGKVRWNFALVTAMSDEAKTQATGPYLTATVDRDGRFRVDDVPAGTYSLSVRFDRDQAGRLRNHPFQVPPPTGESPARPVDLGKLTLDKP
jgi:RNA polymerase sigma factor (sigma-70 family)